MRNCAPSPANFIKLSRNCANTHTAALHLCPPARLTTTHHTRSRRRIGRATAKPRQGLAWLWKLGWPKCPAFCTHGYPTNWLYFENAEPEIQVWLYARSRWSILSVSSANRRSTSITRALSPAASSNDPIDEAAGLSARGLATLVDATTTPDHTNSKSSPPLGTTLLSPPRSTSLRVAWGHGGGAITAQSTAFTSTPLGRDARSSLPGTHARTCG